MTAAATPTKPLFGSACNACGLCCLGGPCSLARAFLPHAEEDKPCPALGWTQATDGTTRSYCGLVKRLGGERFVEEAAKVVIGQGIGCDMTDFADPADVAARRLNISAMKHRARRSNRDASPLAREQLLRWGFYPP